MQSYRGKEMTTDEAWRQLRIALSMALPGCFALVSPQVLRVLLGTAAKNEQEGTGDAG
jgi:hypothetical protein